MPGSTGLRTGTGLFAAHRGLRIHGMLGLAVLALCACGTLSKRAEGVRITAIPSAVEPCVQIGSVSIGSPPFGREDAYRQMQAEVIRRGGNTLLVNSYSGATSGTAYSCLPPLRSDDPRVKPGRDSGQTGPL